MKLALCIVGFTGCICSCITAMFRFANATNTAGVLDGVAWILMGVMTLAILLQAARNW